MVVRCYSLSRRTTYCHCFVKHHVPLTNVLQSTDVNPAGRDLQISLLILHLRMKDPMCQVSDLRRQKNTPEVFIISSKPFKVFEVFIFVTGN